MAGVHSGMGRVRGTSKAMRPQPLSAGQALEGSASAITCLAGAFVPPEDRGVRAFCGFGMRGGDRELLYRRLIHDRASRSSGVTPRIGRYRWPLVGLSSAADRGSDGRARSARTDRRPADFRVSMTARGVRGNAAGDNGGGASAHDVSRSPGAGPGVGVAATRGLIGVG